MSQIRQRYRALRPGLEVGPHTNNQDFWGILFGRPSAFVFLVFFGGISWITPNLLTVLSFLLVLAASALVYWGDFTLWLIAVVCLQLNLTLDCADGQLARYRGASSPLGSYLDKITDVIGFLFLFPALGQLCAERTGEVYYLHFATLGVFAMAVSGYVKWITVADGLERGIDKSEIVRRSAAVIRWWHVPLKLFEFNEPDLFLWISIGLCLDRPEWALWLIAVSQSIMVLAAIIFRGAQTRRFHGMTRDS